VPSSTFPFSVRERVRWSDCDPFGIIYYGAYVRFFEIAEHEMLRSLGLPYDVLRVERDVWIPRKALAMSFDSPAEMDEEIDIAVGVREIGSTSITFAFEVTAVQSGKSRASATLTVVVVDKPTMTKRPVPDWLRAALDRVRIRPDATPSARASPLV
jgi:YbgC/YbaW family acyl-CoA thioester hydrolase